MLKHVIMMVLSDYETCICFKGTIHKFVIIRIRSNKTKMIKHLHHLCVGQIKNGRDNVRSNFLTNFFNEFFFVFRQNFICYTYFPSTNSLQTG